MKPPPPHPPPYHRTTLSQGLDPALGMTGIELPIGSPLTTEVSNVVIVSLVSVLTK